MKLHLYIYALLLSSLIYSQEEEKFTITKGTKELGLTFNYSYQKNSEENTSVNPVAHNFVVAPSLGYALKNNLVLGAQIQFLAIRQTTDGDDFERQFAPDLQTYGFSFFPYLKKYVNINKVLLFNLQGGIGYESIKQEDYNANETININQFSVGVTPGLTFSLSNTLALVADFGFIGYSNAKTKDSRDFVDDIKSNNFEISLNASNVLVGLVYFIK